MRILVTGGAGYIGSHTCILLIEAGYDIVVFDNFCNASKESIARVEKIVGKTIPLIEGDIRYKEDLNRVFESYTIDAVIHFAGLKAVGESVEKPLEYYDNNIYGTLVLCQVMAAHGCKSIVFSSSATVYGDPHSTPIKEDFPLSATNPYGRSKLFIEEMLRDLYVSDPEWKIVLLRYFNPIGAHESGTIGEDPNGIPNNLLPFIAQTAIGTRACLSVFGDDYDTVDGTGVRDYIHVMDLADGHVKALDKMSTFTEIMTINLGTGKGYSVLEVLKAFEAACGKKVPYSIAPRRAGDIATCFADPTYAKAVLGWEAQRGINEMCKDSWRWQSNNPQGYKS
ncbi:MAG TPA: UDP-glucose 4-epimerase GalE [Sulfurovum sp.]|nr:MAG: UDP-glucose 4-epimerase GalE [Sulfurovum sp. 35-42-20]OYY57601.1 MAG: UDP-glucose 4-epimerase GalE [Sulfurovum sp. 28-43-6]OYZ49680.1 MAG: UDP-glucose 4-epimerase GalE [Sulfurovum sp. 24-42-9]OZA59454.1 MAG: UDP-glucose 4-epimerase GalE [Sulfurovum sp. 39-42-12]HQR73469.1 UDP-glucose 4-epimerase GalE [Sulfurovum sp.]